MHAYLTLEDGTCLEGESFGYPTNSYGEVVFSTGMTGYTESLTDPSFAGQILVFTYPLIGNYGVPKPIKRDTYLMENFESRHIWVKGVVVASAASSPSHFTNALSFSDWLHREKIPGISCIDTRALTQKIREKGVLRGRISTKKIKPVFPLLDMSTLVREVSIHKPIEHHPKRWNKKHIAVIDCGVKHGILRALLNRGYRITRVPWDMDPLSLGHQFDGIVVSNGPGDPKDCRQTITVIRHILTQNIPLLGICLGHQLLALAIGADTYKLPYGHRGINQPCLEVTTQKAFITSQNHGYAVDRQTIPTEFTEWFINLNDHTNEGIRHKRKPIRSVQFHPEGNPGPFDTEWIFDTFLHKEATT